MGAVFCIHYKEHGKANALEAEGAVAHAARRCQGCDNRRCGGYKRLNDNLPHSGLTFCLSHSILISGLQLKTGSLLRVRAAPAQRGTGRRTCRR